MGGCGTCVLLLLFFLNAVHGAKQYCTQDSSCWPNATVWHGLKKTLTGELHQLENDDYKICEKQGNDAYKIAAAANGTCMQYHDCSKEFCDTSKGWNIPAYSVAVETVADIQKAIKFANTHNIAVSIKTSGHSYAGSSMGKDTLLIWMHKFIKYNDVKQNYTNTCNTTYPDVIKVGGGQAWKDVYMKLRSDYHIVGGGGLTVSAAGGWLQGCGLSAMSRKYGIGIDNVIDFEVVLADGRHVKADACHNSDLFWALRGGGGGTWGVVTSVHYKIRKAEPVTHLYMLITNINPPLHNPVTVDSWLERWVALSPHLDRRWGGYWTLNNLIMYFVGNKAEAGTTFINAIEAWKRSLPADQQAHVIIHVQENPSYFDSRGADNITTDETGTSAFNIASRLIPRDWVVNNKEKAVEMLRWMVRNGFFTFNYILGGAVTDVGVNDTSVNPAMRKAIWQMETFTDKMAAKMREEVKNTGAGYNHASKKEPDWRNSFWGVHLKKLQDLKKKYDRDNRFNCWHCVGYQGAEDPVVPSSNSVVLFGSTMMVLLVAVAALFIV